MNHDQEIPSKFHFWYVVCPGTIVSKSDGDEHSIGFHTLLSLYGIPPPVRAQVWSYDEFIYRLEGSGRFGNCGVEHIHMIYGKPVLFLKPQVDGDYSWEKLVLKSALESL